MWNHSRRVAAALTAAAASLVLVAGCASSGSATPPSKPETHGSTAGPTTGAAHFPVTVQAANGSVTLATRPSAIVSLSPTATETLYAIGAGSQVKAVDKNSDYPKTAPRTALDANHLNIEAIAKYKPDLVVASNISAAQTKQLHELEIPVLSEPAATNLDQAYREITQLGQATGHQSGASNEVATMKKQIAQIVAGKPAARETYYYELDQTYYSETSATFIGQVLGLLGLHSIADSAKGAASSGGYPQLSAEFILKANPDYIFLADTICCHQSASTVAARPGWSTLHAVQDGRIVALNDDIASRWGPRIVDLLETVAQALRQHPVSAR